MILFKRTPLFVACLFLVGCAVNIPEKLGVSDLEWESYSKEKQKNLLANYERMMKEHGSESKGQEEDEDSKGPFLEVSIYDGKIMFPPSFINWQTYQPVRINIFKGECRNVELRSAADSNSKTMLGVCFRDNILYLDSSHYDLTKKIGTVSIYHSPLWLSGFAYKEINSTGYVKLSNVTVEIKQKEALPPVTKEQPKS